MTAMADQQLTWQELENEIFTPEEILASKARVQIISAVIEARKQKGLSQQQLAELAGVKQPARSLPSEMACFKDDASSLPAGTSNGTRMKEADPSMPSAQKTRMSSTWQAFIALSMTSPCSPF